MKSDSRVDKDDRLEKLLREARPEPDAAFSTGVRTALAGLPAGGTRVRRVPKAVIILAVILITLALGMGVAYASGAFRNIFGSARAKVEERIEEYEATYDEKREQMQDMDEMEAAELDMEMDWQSEKNAGDLIAMTLAEQHAVEIEQEVSGLVLSEFSAAVHELYEPGWIWQMYMSFSAPEDYEYVYDMRVTVDGMELAGNRADLPVTPTEETVNPAIYECWTTLDWTSLPETSLISVELDGRSFCFIYKWSDESFVLPKNDAEREEWLDTNRKLTEAFTALKVTPITGGLYADEINASIVSAELVGNRLVLKLEISVPDSRRSHEMSIFDADLRIGGTYWSSGALEYDHRLSRLNFSEDNTKHPTVTLTMPLSPLSLAGAEFTLILSVYDGNMPEDEAFTYFEFRLGVER